MRKSHYTYLLTAANPIDERELYVGVRTCTGKPEDDVAYFSSSRHVKQAIRAGVVFVKTILAVWPTRKRAAEHEIALQGQLNVAADARYFNKAIHTSTGFDMTGVKRGEQLPEHKAKLSNAHTGRKHTSEARANMGNSRRGKPLSAAHRANVAKGNIGKKRSDETRRRLSEAHLGHKPSPEAIAKVKAALTGRARPDEVRAKIAETLKGHDASDEARLAMVAARKAYHALVTRFCQAHGITAPGKGHKNVDKAAFQRWRKAHGL